MTATLASPAVTDQPLWTAPKHAAPKGRQARKAARAVTVSPVGYIRLAPPVRQADFIVDSAGVVTVADEPLKTIPMLDRIAVITSLGASLANGGDPTSWLLEMTETPAERKQRLNALAVTAGLALLSIGARQLAARQAAKN